MPGIFTSAGAGTKQATLRTARFVCDCRAGVYRPAPPDLITLSAIKKPANILYAAMAIQMRKGCTNRLTLRQAHLFNTRDASNTVQMDKHVCNEWGDGDRTRVKESLQPMSIRNAGIYRHLCSVTYGTGATNTHTKTQKRTERERDCVVNSWAPSSSIRHCYRHD